MDTNTATSSTTRETVAVVAADGYGIDLLHADVTVKDGQRVVEPARQDWIEAAQSGARIEATAVLAERGWRVVGTWRDTAHYGGVTEADVERIA